MSQQNMSMRTLGTAVEPVARSFLHYLHLSSWLDQKITSALAGRPPREFTSVEDFWRAVVQEEIHPGDRIRFKEAFVTEWVPRLPGEPWLHTFSTAGTPPSERFQKLRKGDHRVASEGDILSSSLGVVRLPLSATDELNYAALSLVTIDSWCCDLGVPLLVSSSVYDAFLRRRSGGSAVEADIEGVLSPGELPLLKSEFLASLGEDINQDFLRLIATPVGMPSVYVRIASPLDASFRSHNNHPPGLLWAVLRRVRNAKVKHSIDVHSRKMIIKTEVISVDPYASYPLLTCGVDFTDEEAIRTCVEVFKSGKFSLEEGKPKASRVRGAVSVDVLTEFDSRKRHFASSVPLTRSPWDQQTALAEIKRTLKDLQSAE